MSGTAFITCNCCSNKWDMKYSEKNVSRVKCPKCKSNESLSFMICVILNDAWMKNLKG